MFDIDIDEASQERLVTIGQTNGDRTGFDVLIKFARDGHECGAIIGICPAFRLDRDIFKLKFDAGNNGTKNGIFRMGKREEWHNFGSVGRFVFIIAWRYGKVKKGERNGIRKELIESAV